MKIFLENVNLNSNGGPNSFAKKLIPSFTAEGHSLEDVDSADVSLCFIESPRSKTIPRIQRLDGIYYNIRFNFEQQNRNIKRTYDESDSVIFQSEYGKNLVQTFFGEHRKSAVIHNGADLRAISNVKQLPINKEGRKIWSCAASWRPHKRLSENIRYFLEHKGPDDLLMVAGDVQNKLTDSGICYLGNISQDRLYSIYKASDYFLHLAWLDCCPNVVVDARACGATVICASSGGSKEIAGPNSIVIEEEPWDFTPLDLYDPPKLNFDNKLNNLCDSGYDIDDIAKRYINQMEEIL